MIIDRKYQIEAACCPPTDRSRPILNCLYIAPPPDMARPIETVAVAANGYLLAVVPVMLEEDDILGAMEAFARVGGRSASLLQLARKATPKHQDSVSIRLGEESVTLSDGATFPRYAADAGSGVPFPDYAMIVPEMRRGESANLVGLRVPYTHMLAQALGSESLTFVLGETHGPCVASPILVLPLDEHKAFAPPADGRPTAPYGVLMPMLVR